MFGASGMIGSRILSEAVTRGHDVIAIGRDPKRIPPREGVTARKGDVLDTASVAETARGAELAISSYGPSSDEPHENLSKSVNALLQGLPQAGVRRVIVIGGAGSLEVAPGVLLVDTPSFPGVFRARARAQKTQLDMLRASVGATVAWTFVSPPAAIAPGRRTGTFRVGDDRLLVGQDGQSRISAEDFAIAIVDEAERVKHLNERFTVGY